MDGRDVAWVILGAYVFGLLQATITIKRGYILIKKHRKNCSKCELNKKCIDMKYTNSTHCTKCIK